MSYQGQTWVDEVAFPHLEKTGELIIMLRVANHAGNGPKKMSGCFARSEVLAAECLMSPRAAQGHLRELARRGLLIPGDPKLVEHIRPDIRPPVWDLAGAHQPGCPGGHDVDGECQLSGAGSKIFHPSGQTQNRRSAGSKICHPSGSKPGTGSKKRPERVAKSATIKSSKELKESLSPGASPSPAAPGVSAEAGERDPAAQNDLHADAGQVLAAYEQALGGPALNGTRAQLLKDASELLEARPLSWVIDRARELPKYGKSLMRHAEMSKVPFNEQASIPAARKACPLNACDGGGIVYRDPELMLGPSRCACRSQHAPA